MVDSISTSRSESDQSSEFTIVFGKSDAPDFHRLPLSHAKRALTLACLIPSGTRTFTIHLSCRRECVAVCAQALALLAQTPLSFTYEMSATLPQYYTLTDGLTTSQLQEAASIADALGMTSFAKFCGEKSLEATSSTSNLETDINFTDRSQSAIGSTAVSSARFLSDSVSPPGQMFIISDSGTSYSLRGVLSELSPVLSEAVAAGNDHVVLEECDGDSIVLAIEFMELLTRVPLFVKSKSISSDQTFSDMVPGEYDDLLRDRVSLTDGSGGRIWKVCDALQLETLRLLLSLKTASLLTSFNPSAMFQHLGRPSITQSVLR